MAVKHQMDAGMNFHCIENGEDTNMYERMKGAARHRCRTAKEFPGLHTTPTPPFVFAAAVRWV